MRLPRLTKLDSVPRFKSEGVVLWARALAGGPQGNCCSELNGRFGARSGPRLHPAVSAETGKLRWTDGHCINEDSLHTSHVSLFLQGCKAALEKKPHVIRLQWFSFFFFLKPGFCEIISLLMEFLSLENLISTTYFQNNVPESAVILICLKVHWMEMALKKNHLVNNCGWR